MYTESKFVNSSELTISFSLPYHDWCLLRESVLWGRLDKYLEACQSTDIQKSPQERAKILEIANVQNTHKANWENYPPNLTPIQNTRPLSQKAKRAMRKANMSMIICFICMCISIICLIIKFM